MWRAISSTYARLATTPAGPSAWYENNPSDGQPTHRRSGLDPESRGAGPPALPDTNRSTRRPVAVSSRRTIQESPDVASDLKYLLQADDHA